MIQVCYLLRKMVGLFYQQHTSNLKGTIMAHETTYKPTRFGVATDYDYTGKRDKVIVWSGSFMGTFEAEGLSLPKGDGYMLTTYNGDKVRVSCPVRRESHNYVEIDEAISKALNAHYEAIGARSIA